ncbi:MAG: AAA family ATPase [Promethearchaeota archaeon]
METEHNYFREKVWFIINTIQANQLFVHSNTLLLKYAPKTLLTDFLNPQPHRSKKSTKKKKKKTSKRGKAFELPEILTLCILNALVPNSAMLLVGGHGGGKTSIVKYLGRMFTGMTMDEAEECILRGHPQLTEEKIIATLNLPKLLKEGQEKVIWRTFATSFWKIIDEVNRCSPYTQNILLSLLAEGKIKYYDSVLDVSKYCIYATFNPNDVGTFELSMPFLDRFGISVPISMPTSQDLSQILRSRDEKLGGYDELVQIPEVLSEEDVLNIWFEVGEVPCSLEAENYIHAIIREYTLCDRIDKGNSDYLKPSTGLCAGCHYNIPEKIPCSNCDSILSVRVAKDLLRYGRALTWLLGMPEITLNVIETVAPYVIAHRVKYVDRFLNQAPFWGNKYAFTKNILKMVRKRFLNRSKAYKTVDLLREGKAPDDALEQLKTFAKIDLIVHQDLLPLAKKLDSKAYREKIHQISEAYHTKNVDLLVKIRKELLYNMDFPNRGYLISMLNEKIRVLTLYTFNCSLEIWNTIRFTVDSLIPQFSRKLRESTQRRGTYRLRTEDIELEVNVTGTNPHDIVNFSFYGGEMARKLRKEIEKNHQNMLKTMDELLQESKIAQQKKEEELSFLESPKDGTSAQKSPDLLSGEKKKSLFSDDFYEE